MYAYFNLKYSTYNNLYRYVFLCQIVTLIVAKVYV